MQRTIWICCLTLVWSGCGTSLKEQVRHYNEDGVYLYQQGDFTGARQSFQAALSLQPDNPDLLYNIAECFDRQGQTSRAEEIYRQCLVKAPNHVRCRHGLAVLLVKTDRRKEAIFMIEEWLARAPKKAEPYAEDGWLWRQAGDLDKAQARLQQALDLDRNNIRALTELGVVYEQLGFPERARVLYEQALELDPRQTEINQRLRDLKAKGIGTPKP